MNDERLEQKDGLTNRGGKRRTEAVWGQEKGWGGVWTDKRGGCREQDEKCKGVGVEKLSTSH